MTATYTGPSNSSADKVRFLLGDTDTSNAQLTDEEIAWLLTEYPDSYYRAAAAGARILGAKYTKLQSKSVGDLAIQYGDSRARYAALAEQLEGMANTRGRVKPYAGGISKSDKDTDEANTDLVGPRFKRNIHDNPQAGSSQQNDEDIA